MSEFTVWAVSLGMLAAGWLIGLGWLYLYNPAAQPEDTEPRRDGDGDGDREGSV
jgi:hypothetical protein